MKHYTHDGQPANRPGVACITSSWRRMPAAWTADIARLEVVRQLLQGAVGGGLGVGVKPEAGLELWPARVPGSVQLTGRPPVTRPG